ncbi:MAG: hypothetical protein LBV43_07290 [Prevotella sp.]|jgi:hypothetical protein|nr:hypothetical protein [Prevotella sp.]
MRLLFGILSTIIVLTGAVLTVLALWDIYPISWAVIWRSVATIAIVCVVILLMWLFKYLFFKKDPFGQNSDKRNT